MLIPEGFAQVNFVLTGSAVPTGAEMTIGVRLDTAGTPDDVGSALEDAFAVASPWQYMTDECQLSSMHIKFGPNVTGASTDYPLVDPGTNTDDSQPPNTSMLIQKITLAGGRAGRGRMYMPGFGEASIDQSGNYTTLVRNNVQTAWNSVLSEMDTANFPFVVLHGADSPLSIPSTIVSFNCATVAATQRKRLRR